MPIDTHDNHEKNVIGLVKVNYNVKIISTFAFLFNNYTKSQFIFEQLIILLDIQNAL